MSNQMNQSKKMEQRNYARLKSNLDAQFITASSNKYSCVIIDFCIHGMRLSVSETQNLADELRISVGQRLTIQYTAKWSNQPKLFEVTGIVAQVNNQEIGLKIPSFQPEAFQAIRSSNAHQPLNTRNGKDSSTTQDVMSELFDQLQKMINIATNRLFENVDIRMQNAHDESTSIADQGIYKFAIKHINSTKIKIHDDLIESIKKHTLSEIIEPKKNQKQIELNTLTLISHSDIDDWIHASSIATKLNEIFNTELTELGQRLADLVNLPLTDKDHPFSPSTLMEGLRDALQTNLNDIEYNNEIRIYFYEEFGKVLENEYPHLIQDLDKIIPKSGQILTKKKHTHSEENARQNVNKIKNSSHADSLNPELNSSTFDFNTIMQRIEMLNNPSKTKNLDNLSEEYSPEKRNSQIPPSPKKNEAMSGLLTSLQKIGKSIFGINPQDEHKNEAHSFVSSEDISLAIDILASHPNKNPSLTLSDRIQNEINAGSSELRLMTEKEREALDGMSSLYEKAIPSEVKPTEITQLLKRIENPLLKIALKDDKILQSSQHPARRVADLIEQFSIATDADGNIVDSLVQKNLNDVVEKITNDYQEGGTAYLETAKQSLENLLDPLQKNRLERINELQASSEKDEHERDAQRKTSEYLEARFADTETAELTIQLLEEGWKQYLAEIIMQDGMSGSRWNQGEIAYERLTTWSEPSFKPDSKHRFEISAWLAMVERHLSSVCTDADRLKIFMAKAIKSLAQTQYPTSKPLSRVYVPVHHFISPEDTAQKIREKYIYLIDRLKIGEWWDFFQNNDWIPMQLIWMSQPPGRCAFTNRSATNKMEVSLDQFNQYLESNVIRPGEDIDLPIFERAEHAIIDNEFNSILHNTTHSHIQGMWNRNGFMLNLSNISRDRRRLDQLHVLMVIGFDQISMLYTQRGIEVGDALINNIATSFTSLLRKEDIVALFSEDSFALFLLNVDQQYTQSVADKIMKELKNYSFSFQDEVYSIGINIGLVNYIPSTMTPEEGFRRADAAYNSATKLGRNTMQWYDTTNATLEDQQSLAKWAGRINHLFQDKRFYLRCQMIIPLGHETPALPRYEILLGIDIDDMSISEDISAAEFIPILERLRRIHEIDLWVIREFFIWADKNENIVNSVDSFSINISAMSLSDLDILNFLHEQSAINEHIASKIFFEITETVAIEAYNAAQNFINQIRGYGYRFSIDDFGSGHSSYTHLKKLNTEELKIDGFFVKDIHLSNKDYAMVKSMNEIAHSLGMLTVAEHVDSIEAIKCLREIGVDYAQGYYLHKPMPLNNLSISHFSKVNL